MTYKTHKTFVKILPIAIVLALTLGIGQARAQDTTGTVAPVKSAVTGNVPSGIDTRAGIEINKEIRNDKMMERKDERKDIRDTRKENVKEIRSDFKDAKREMKGDIKDARKDMKAAGMTPRDIHASTTVIFKAMQNEKKEMGKKMQGKVFEERKNALVKELNISISNITNIRARINERITALEADGKVVTDAKAALAIADGKLADAKAAIEAFAKINYVAPAVGTGTKVGTNANASSSANIMAEVDLTKPRQAGDAAIKAVKEARDAFKKVVDITIAIK